MHSREVGRDRDDEKGEGHHKANLRGEEAK
jgi:hypothetical protein